MFEFSLQLTPAMFVLATLIAVIAGFVKGTVGFAMPMILISGLSTFLPADMALGVLIFPTLVTNGVQALRQGLAAAVQSIRQFRVFLGIGCLCLLASAQTYTFLPQSTLFLLVGIPVLFFSLLQLLGWQLRLRAGQRKPAEILVGGFAGLVGGVSGVWGPPTVMFLTALGTEKAEQMRIQGGTYGLGAVALFVAHLKSGVVNAQTAPVPLLMCVPALAGLYVGFRYADRLDAKKFRQITLLVLVVAGANLIRKGAFG